MSRESSAQDALMTLARLLLMASRAGVLGIAARGLRVSHLLFSLTRPPGSENAVSRAVARDKPVAASVVIPR